MKSIAKPKTCETVPRSGGAQGESLPNFRGPDCLSEVSYEEVHMEGAAAIRSPGSYADTDPARGS